MTRTLLLIAGAGFVLAAACFAGAAALGGQALFQGHWRPSYEWRWGFYRYGPWARGDRDAAPGQDESRQIAWTGGDSLDLDLPADVRFTQAAGPGVLTVSGPRDEVDDVQLSGSHLGLDDGDHWGRVTVVMTAPAVRRFSISGDSTLAIDGFDQDDLDVVVSGDGAVTAKGKAQAARVDISGDGDVDLGGLTVQTAMADISGSGRARLAPADAADLRISGDGEIDLLTHPATLDTDVSGAGRIVEGAAAASPATSRVG